MVKKTYSVYLSSASVIDPPISKYSNIYEGGVDPATARNVTNSYIRYNANFRDVFGAELMSSERSCTVRFNFQSRPDVAGTVLSSANNFGTLRANFQSIHCSATNLLPLGMVVVRPTGEGDGRLQLVGDTTTGLGVGIQIPTNNEIIIALVQGNEQTLMPNVPEYQLQLIFEIE